MVLDEFIMYYKYRTRVRNTFKDHSFHPQASRKKMMLPVSHEYKDVAFDEQLNIKELKKNMILQG